MAGITNDGIFETNILSTTFSGTNGLFTSLTISGNSVTSDVAGSPNTGVGQVAVAGQRAIGGYGLAGSGTGGWITFPSAFGGPANVITLTQASAAPSAAFILPSIAPGSIGAGSFWVQVSGVQAGSVYYIAIGA